MKHARVLRDWFSPLRPESDAMLHLDMLRFVASAGIVWHHSHEFLVPVEVRAATTMQTQALALFVDLFFAISGYVITQVYAERLIDGASYRRFLQRRVGRLIPLHWLTLGLSLAFWVLVAHAGIAVTSEPDRSAACVVHTAMLLNGLFVCGNGYVLNGVTWSISAEMALYILFPVMLAGMRRGWLLPLCLCTLLITVVLTVNRDGRWDNIHPILRALPSFLFGMTLSHYRSRLPVLNHSWPIISLTVLLFVLMMTRTPQLLVLGCVYALIASAVAADRRHNPTRAVRWCAALGQLTYGIYMWHSLFILVLLNAFGDKYFHLKGNSMIALVAFCYIAIFYWSYLSLRLFETPARRWIDRL